MNTETLLSSHKESDKAEVSCALPQTDCSSIFKKEGYNETMDFSKVKVTEKETTAVILAIFIPFLQVMSFALNSLVSILALPTLFANSELLPLVNLLAIFAIVIGIGVIWYWKENQWYIHREGMGNENASSQKNVFKVLLILSVSTIITILLFTTITLGFLNGSLAAINFAPTFQIILYFLILLFGGLSVYIGLQEFFQYKERENEHDLIGNLQLALRKNGTVAEPRITIHSNTDSTDEFGKKLDVTIGGDRYILETSYDGSEIKSVIPKK